jgi:glycosyltransferase involved in cell wall biosynthesis
MKPTISFIIPSYNNLRHLKNAYFSIKKHASNHEIILLDDGSLDGTWEWILSLTDTNIQKYRSKSRVGHTVLYDVGINLAKNDIVSILHADMIIGPNYVENLLKHLKPNKVVCATRVEPPLHPSGKEKITQNFGLDFDNLDITKFESFCSTEQLNSKDKTTKGMFAPWILYKKDFQSIGGHDHMFSPFPYEDSDIFQRWILNGFELIQSRDALVYHLTCRGHRWTEKIQKDDDFYKECCYKNSRNFIRKWGSWIKNDEYSYPILTPKFNIGFIIHNCNTSLLQHLEPWASNLYVNCKKNEYINQEQSKTSFDLSSKIKNIDEQKNNDVIVEFDGSLFNKDTYDFLTSHLPNVLKDSGELGEMEYDIFKLHIKSLKTYENDLINVKNS